MVYGYVRVSTEKQTVENQKLEIQRFCKKIALGKVSYTAETISGKIQIDKRKLGLLIEKLNSGDIIVVTELSRLGRSMLMILNVLQLLKEKNVRLYAIKEGFELGDNIQSQVIAFAFGLCAEIERNLISERTKQGLERVRKEGRHIGRPKGQKSKHLKLDEFKTYIIKERKKGRSKLSLANELNVTWLTLNSYMKLKRIN